MLMIHFKKLIDQNKLIRGEYFENGIYRYNLK